MEEIQALQDIFSAVILLLFFKVGGLLYLIAPGLITYFIRGSGARKVFAGSLALLVETILAYTAGWLLELGKPYAGEGLGVFSIVLLAGSFFATAGIIVGFLLSRPRKI